MSFRGLNGVGVDGQAIPCMGRCMVRCMDGAWVPGWVDVEMMWWGWENVVVYTWVIKI